MQIDQFLQNLTLNNKSRIKHDFNYFRVFFKDIDFSNTKIIHIAGTNGKGSVANYINSYLCSINKSVGMFTSPHLVDVCERIRINNAKISSEEFLEYANYIQKIIDENNYSKPSYFEFLFIVAILHFAKNKVSYIILETGIGGKQDCTNYFDKKFLSIITSIGIDHKEILGDTIEEIAKDKAGIINSDAYVIYLKNKKTNKAIREQIKIRHAKYKAIKPRSKYNTKNTYQTDNRKIALAAIKYINKTENIKYSKNDINIFLQNVKWAGRFETINNLVFDGGHNMQGLRAFFDSYGNVSNKYLIIAISAKKETEKMIEYIASLDFEYVYFTNNKNNELSSPGLLNKYYNNFKSNSCIIEFDDISDLISDKTKQFIITGSLYLIGDIYKYYLGDKK